MINCSGGCDSRTSKVEVYTLNTIFNPTNSTQTAHFYLDKSTIPLKSSTFQKYDFSLIESILNTDTSWFPWENINTSHCLELDEFKLLDEDSSNINESVVHILFERSPKTYIFEAVHLKFLDAFAFVGGIF